MRNFRQSHCSLLARIMCTAALLVLLGGCSTSAEFKPLVFTNVVLQEPLPGQSLVYLLRVPHDGATVSVQVDGRLVAELPPETYTAFSVAPGEIALTAFIGGFLTPRVAAAPVVIKLTANQRVFLALPGTQERRAGGIFFMGGIPVPIVDQDLSTTAREWKLFTDLDAGGLIGISRAVLPVLPAR